MSPTVKIIKDRPSTGIIHNKRPFHSSPQICGLFSHNFFTCHFDENGRCHNYAWRPWLTEFSGVAPVIGLSRSFSLDYFPGCIVHETGRLVQSIVQVNSLFNAMGPETCELQYGIIIIETSGLHYIVNSTIKQLTSITGVVTTDWLWATDSGLLYI